METVLTFAIIAIGIAGGYNYSNKLNSKSKDYDN